MATRVYDHLIKLVPEPKVLEVRISGIRNGNDGKFWTFFFKGRPTSLLLIIDTQAICQVLKRDRSYRAVTSLEYRREAVRANTEPRGLEFFILGYKSNSCQKQLYWE